MGRSLQGQSCRFWEITPARRPASNPHEREIAVADLHRPGLRERAPDGETGIRRQVTAVLVSPSAGFRWRLRTRSFMLADTGEAER
jgi:hypothetical protein